jgi:hypothetical protein
MSSDKKEAHRILDLVRVGWDVPDMTILWALVILGDMELHHV